MAGAMTLAEFLVQRIAEDEAAARRVTRYELMTALNRSLAPAAEPTLFVARNDPARVLLDCELRRAMVELWQDPDELPIWSREEVVRAVAVEDCLRLLAVPYADHADYDESWRP